MFKSMKSSPIYDTDDKPREKIVQKFFFFILRSSCRAREFHVMNSTSTETESQNQWYWLLGMIMNY